MLHDCISQGIAVPPEMVVEFHDSSPDLQKGSLLQQRMHDDGYLFFRGILNREQVLEARQEVFGRLAAVGEIREPAIDGIATGTSHRLEREPDLTRFWKSVSEGPALRRVTHGDDLRRVAGQYFGEKSIPHEYMFLRPAAFGQSTNLHYDFPFFAGGSNHIVTVWVPFGDIPLCDGPLMIVEGSHRFDDLVQPMKDAMLDPKTDFATIQQAAYMGSTSENVKLLHERNTRILSTNFLAGDVIIFSMFTMHGSLDNHSSAGRVRLSVDVRYQPAADPHDDPRFFGPNPTGAKGGSYGEQKAAQPLTAPWVSRQ
ncbi:MAG: phytanoyl-CoA dioxygenase family protein [Planctomycetota bacterium]|nr:phytanoyl-CoA dioxygenase family protein [Planctomycetota bacterium]MDA1211627.1 phytanoyl-CoA dioxygenase family protein [Planctomycetota bacterium]